MDFRIYKYNLFIKLLGSVLLLVVLNSSAWAVGQSLLIELSAMGSYSKTNYGNNTYATSRRYSASAAVYITQMTQIELSFMSSNSFFNYDPIQTTNIDEQTLSLSVVQAILPPELIVQPYAKAGLAQYNRQQSGTVNGIPTAETKSKSPSAVLGGGVRLFLLKNFSLRGEFVTYLPDMKISEASNNINVQGGISWSF